MWRVTRPSDDLYGYHHQYERRFPIGKAPHVEKTNNHHLGKTVIIIIMLISFGVECKSARNRVSHSWRDNHSKVLL